MEKEASWDIQDWDTEVTVGILPNTAGVVDVVVDTAAASIVLHRSSYDCDCYFLCCCHLNATNDEMIRWRC